MPPADPSLFADALVLALVTSTTSVTLGKARVFAPLRAWCRRRGPWLGDLVHCPYCLSHWIALVLVLVYRPRVIRGPAVWIDVLVGVFFVVAVAAAFSAVLCRALSEMDRLGD